jgi:hypothetical protein
MTVETFEFDPELTGHGAVLIDGVAHATRTRYSTDSGDPYSSIECEVVEVDVPFDKMGCRGEMLDRNMCPECWPNSVLD